MISLSEGAKRGRSSRRWGFVVPAGFWWFTATFLLCSLIHGGNRTHAGHPLGTEDTGTQGRGKAELELNVETAKLGKDWQYTLGNILTLGIADPVDVSIEYAYLFLDPRNADSIDGFGDTGLFLKYAKPPPSPGDTQAGIKIGGIFPTGDESKGTGSGAKDYVVRLILEKEGNPYRLFLNLSYLFAGNRPGGVSPDDVFGASFAVVQGPAGKGGVSAVAEIEYRTPEFSGQEAIVSALGGFVLALSETSQLSFGVAWGIRGDAPDVLFTAGLTLGFQ